MPRLLWRLLQAYIVFLPIQFDTGGSMRIAPSDAFIGLYILFGLPYVRLVRGAWSWGQAALILLFFTGTLVAVLDTGVVGRYVLVNKDIGLLILFVTFAIVTTAASSMQEIRSLARLYVGTVAVNAGVSIAAYVLWRSYRIDLPVNYQHDRLSGFLVDPNAFGGLVAVAASLHLITYFGNVPLIGGRTGALVGLILAGGLALTFSRSSWIGFSAGCLSALILAPRTGMRLLAATAIGAIAVVGVALRGDLASIERMARRPDQIQARMDQFTHAVPLISNHPLFGIGLGRFVEKYDVIVHNTSMWMVTEFGFVGLLVFGAFFVNFLLRGTAAHQAAGQLERPLIIGLICAHLSMLGVSMGIEALYQRHWWLVMALLSAVYLNVTGGNRTCRAC